MGKTTIAIALLVATGLLVSPATAQKIRIGEHVDRAFETRHPYTGPGGDVEQLVWTDRVHHPGAVYVALHFSNFSLAPGDYVVVRSPSGEQSYRYEGNGRRNLGVTPEGFYATHIKGDTAIVELYARGIRGGYGYTIDRYGRGYSPQEIREFWAAGLGESMGLPRLSGAPESICINNDTENAVCYETSEPTIYDRSRTVARLLVKGAFTCTGWLVGCEGHLMTNEQCITTQTEADNTDYEFMAEGPTCGTNCEFTLACPGTIEATGGDLIQDDAPLDYAFVLPDTSTVSGTDLNVAYGFLTLRQSGAVNGERIYIPQHPAAWGRHIAVESDYPLEPNPPFPSVVSVSEPACSGGPGDIGYWADNQGGSSGSPVLGYDDHQVIALHHCRGVGFCDAGTDPPDDPNRGVPIEAIISDLGANLPECALGPILIDGFESGVTMAQLRPPGVGGLPEVRSAQARLPQGQVRRLPPRTPRIKSGAGCGGIQLQSKRLLPQLWSMTDGGVGRPLGRSRVSQSAGTPVCLDVSISAEIRAGGRAPGTDRGVGGGVDG